jgi:hypothetical protein
MGRPVVGRTRVGSVLKAGVRSGDYEGDDAMYISIGLVTLIVIIVLLVLLL